MKLLKPGAMLLLSLLWFTAINPAAFAAGTWTLTGSMHTARDGHTATLLSNGNVVVAGGESNNLAIHSTEVYSPTTHAWSVTGNLNVARSHAQALRLANGLVLVAGGCVSNCQGSVTSSAELYNSTSRVWSVTGAMTRPRTYFGAVMIAGGRILAMGGCTALNANGCASATATAEIYNPATGKWAATGSMTVARNTFTATVLPNGKVLVAGGSTAAGDSLSSSELYNPTTGTWAATGRMNVARSDHTATLLATGKVLAAGGENISGTSTSKTELFNPATGTWTLTANLNSGRPTVLSSAELYDPVARTWTRTGFLHNARAGHTSTLLPSGSVLDAAGSGPTDELISTELYAP